MKLEQSSIYIELIRLRKILCVCQYDMQKYRRVCDGSRLLMEINQVIKDFVIAYSVPNMREQLLANLIGDYGVLRVDIDYCLEENILHFRKRKPKKDKDGHPLPQDVADKVSSFKVDMVTILGKIDADMNRWNRSVVGKTPTAHNQVVNR